MSFDAIHAALDRRAYSFATGNGFTGQVAWENAPFTPTVGIPWMRPTFLPAETSQAALGENGPNKALGVYQVDLFYPVNTGSGQARQTADSVISKFKRGTIATYSAVKIVIGKAFRSTARTENDWYHIPVIVFWHTYVDNI